MIKSHKLDKCHSNQILNW